MAQADSHLWHFNLFTFWCRTKGESQQLILAIQPQELHKKFLSSSETTQPPKTAPPAIIPVPLEPALRTNQPDPSIALT